MRRAKATVARMYGEAGRAPESARKKLGEHALKSESERGIKAMISLAECEVAVRPEDLDADLMLLNAENGTLDLRTGELLPHNPADLITKLAPVRFDPNATHPAWDSFLDRMVPDPEVRAFLRRAVGYSLTGHTTEEKLFFVHGPTASGKSTFADAVKAVIGDYAAVADFETFLRKRGDGGVRNDIARLAGVRMAVGLEVDEGRALAEALIKNLTGGDRIAARHLYQDYFEFKPAFKLWLVANDKPRASAADGALWRRILLIPFEVSLPEEERDPAVKEQLTQHPHARAAILAWAVRGLRDWQAGGLRPPAAVRRATDAYREEQDTLAPFLADCCVLAPGAFVTTKSLRAAYHEWCEKNGEKPLGANGLAARLRDHGGTPDKSRDRGKARGWSGLRLRNIDDPSADTADTADSSFGKVPYEREVVGSYRNSRPQVSAVSADLLDLASPTAPVSAPDATNGSGAGGDPVRPAGATVGAHDDAETSDPRVEAILDSVFSEDAS